MVVFTCQHCGESLKKAAVEKHYRVKKCHNYNPHVTCVDCLKDFFGQDYTAHTSCVTEHERYSAKGTVIKEGTGKKKQQMVLNAIEHLLNMKNLNPQQHGLLEALSGFDNVPRKESQFVNFVSNITKNMYPKHVVTSVFQLITDTLTKEAEHKNVSVVSQDNKDSVVETNGETPNQNDCSETSIGEESLDKNSSKILNDLKENFSQISKKEMKKQKKHEKYLAELESAKHGVSGSALEESMESIENCNKNLRKMKKKKLHLHENNVNGLEERTEELVCKKKKKRKLDETESVIAEKKTKASPEVLEENGGEEFTETGSEPFDWSTVILRILRAKPDKELKLKRLQKKVISEYQTLKPNDHRTYDQLLAKFNKKVKKTPGVCVLNEKAKLKLSQ